MSVTATDRHNRLDRVEAVDARGARTGRDRRISEAELTKAESTAPGATRFENDSVTNIAHQLGYFETGSPRRTCSDGTGRD